MLPFEDLDGNIVWKKVKAIIGVGSKNPWPHHFRKLPRRKVHQHQFLLKPGSYDIVWVEFVCVEGVKIERTGREPGHTQRAKRHYSCRHAQAKSMITRLLSFDAMELGEAPPKRVRCGPPTFFKKVPDRCVRPRLMLLPT